jgi:FMN phosphatase YigB (HAD superfamily)
MASYPIPSGTAAAPPKPWILPESGLTVFHGHPETPRLFHYFLPRLTGEGKQVLCLDGANRFDPLLIARLARQRGKEPSEFNRHIRVGRAFTCFQLSELLARVPRFLQGSAANVLMVTGLPDLYFDEDVRERDAVASFTEALESLRALRSSLLAVGIFSNASSLQTPRRLLFQMLIAQADQVWTFTEQEGGRLALLAEKAQLPQGRTLR